MKARRIEASEVDAVARDFDEGELGKEPARRKEPVLVDGEIVADPVADPVGEEQCDLAAIA